MGGLKNHTCVQKQGLQEHHQKLLPNFKPVLGL
jgi:hypothetical protein